MYLSEKVNGAELSISENEGKIEFKAENCKIPLRVYAFTGNKYEYAGIAMPSGSGSRLEYRYKNTPERILVTRGRIEDEHENICEFVFSAEKTEQQKPEITKKSESETEKFIFSHPALNDCVRYYGHYFSFEIPQGKVLAFPSDFFMHPLLHLIPYAFWYPASFGEDHSGYYLIGITKSDEPFFVDEKVLTEITRNSKIEKIE